MQKIIDLERYMEWDDRYRTEINKPPRQPRLWLVDHEYLLPRSGWALDAAMGLGNNSGFLVNGSRHVLGLDRSIVAAKFAHVNYPGVDVVVSDLGMCKFPENFFSIICNFYFLDRDLIPKYWQWLQPGGIILFETLTKSMLQTCPEISPDRLLLAGELLVLFQGWEILDYREGTILSDHLKEKDVASIVAKKPLL